VSAKPRLVIALSIASLLTVFLVYQLVNGSGQLVVSVAQLNSNLDGSAVKTVQLTGMTVSCEGGPCTGRQAPFTFMLKDEGSPQTIKVNYEGGVVPDAFREGRRVMVTGRLEGSTFVAQTDSLTTKCPSKYSGGSTA
jgi:cytochrome c-type biogenesis protein CcmE